MLYQRALLILLILLTHSILGAEIPPVSEAMKQILHDRLVGQHDLRVDGLTKLNWTPAKMEELQKKVSVEVYRVPYPQRTADYFGYTIYRVKSDNRFLNVKTGGIAGLFQVYSSFQE